MAAYSDDDMVSITDPVRIHVPDKALVLRLASLETSYKATEAVSSDKSASER